MSEVEKGGNSSKQTLYFSFISFTQKSCLNECYRQWLWKSNCNPFFSSLHILLTRSQIFLLLFKVVLIIQAYNRHLNSSDESVMCLWQLWKRLLYLGKLLLTEKKWQERCLRVSALSSYVLSTVCVCVYLYVCVHTYSSKWYWS